MSLFSFLFPAAAARLARAERLAAQALQATGYDETADPALAAVVAEIRNGREIKAAELYTKVTGCTVAEAALAVEQIRSQLA